MSQQQDMLLEKAKENLSAASLLYEKEMYNAAANRAYYSVFQIVLNNMLKNGKAEKEQHQNRHIKAVEYMRKMFQNDTITKFNQLMSLRKKSDYEQVIIEKEEIDISAINALFCDIKEVLG